jgi:hypothetical protein
MTLHYCITSQCLLFITSQYSFYTVKNVKRLKLFYNLLQLADACVICGHSIFKYIIKTTIHDKNLHPTPINPRPISALGPTALGLILESRVDRRCDTDFAMYYSLCSIYSYCIITRSQLKYAMVNFIAVISLASEVGGARGRRDQILNMHHTHVTIFWLSYMERERETERERVQLQNFVNTKKMPSLSMTQGPLNLSLSEIFLVQ